MYLSGKINKPAVIDLLIILFTGIILITYNYRKDMLPDGLAFSVQLCSGWFLFRILYTYFPSFPLYTCVGILLFGLVEAVWGLGQLYDFFPSKHRLFKTTGSFMNPGPYGGFIALLFPLALHYWFVFKHTKKWIGYLFLFVGAVCMMVFPATLSRAAWVAAVAGCLPVLLMDTPVVTRLRIFWRRHKRKSIITITIVSILLFGGVYGIYYLKKDSADGRMFMWKITALAISESPLKGTGPGGFSAAYAKAQIEYFKSDKATQAEKLVAGCPDYAFNEYLQIFLEQGLTGIILFLSLTCLIIKNGIKNRQIGAAGSFLALSVFALASYPYRLWEFPVVWIMLGTVCIVQSGYKTVEKQPYSWKKIIPSFLLIAILCSISITGIIKQKEFYQAEREWKKQRSMYKRKAYTAVIDGYAGLYPLLDHKRKFVFEYGRALNESGEKEKADSIFGRGLEISCDAMFYNVRGRNYYEMGEYDKAENCYIKSTLLLPERIYPYFLLTKLYADPANYQPDKMVRAANAVLQKEPKVHSMAIMEMRAEVRKILKEKGISHE
ncbi:O-antigen ligase family protein [Proteiniphilum sp.]|uniref:O-antigen ligase family protein n=1 Tax=Proteiniphilum sp. TaxID=1926877 RepID=UPI002B218A74|nr:O-antigen ligase family protein [Proteiniphilum sp.]MEA4919285.1 O-antigen ligase family protein [Proteiniphilum sp.]